VDQLSELLTTLFDVSSLEAGLLSISPRLTDLGALARDVSEGMRSTARHHLEVFADQSVVGEWDERRIRQVLVNLLSNALKYSLEGSTVTVSVAADERGATVRVRDEGLGLDGTELAQLFRRGYRAESARNVTGGGLGLYFSNGIVAAHGGRMWAESLGHGQGSTFCFTLPLRGEHTAGCSASAARSSRSRLRLCPRRLRRARNCCCPRRLRRSHPRRLRRSRLRSSRTRSTPRCSP
jgi:signal transduction histidine kinase